MLVTLDNPKPPYSKLCTEELLDWWVECHANKTLLEVEYTIKGSEAKHYTKKLSKFYTYETWFRFKGGWLVPLEEVTVVFET